MKKTFLIGLLAAGLLVSATEIVQAQDTMTQQDITATAAAQGGPKVVTLAGCLDRGPGGGEYTLFGPNLNSWVLLSDSVDLDIYVNEEIQVAAVKSPGNDGDLTVTQVKVMVHSCTSW